MGKGIAPTTQYLVAQSIEANIGDWEDDSKRLQDLIEWCRAILFDVERGTNLDKIAEYLRTVIAEAERP